MSERAAYRKLGLIDPDYYSECAVLSNFANKTGPDPLRQSGRTTRMLVNAAIKLAEGYSISISTGNNEVTKEMHEICKTYAKKLNRNMGTVSTKEGVGWIIGVQNFKTPTANFTDHYDYYDWTTRRDPHSFRR